MAFSFFQEMFIMSIPLLSENQIINYCGIKNYQRGRECVEKDIFYIAYKQAMALEALCQGKSLPSYFVKVLFDIQGIMSSFCTCYSNIVGPCKHIAALLIMWSCEPRFFPARNQISKKLQKTKKQDLIKLVEKCLDLYVVKQKPMGLADKNYGY
jgi:uncharacterized Zn finger protein